MMAFVHDHHRAKLVDDLQQGGGVGILHRMGGSAQSLRQLCQTAVLLPCLELLFFASEGIVGQHQNGKLLGNCRDVEPCGRQKLVFGLSLLMPTSSPIFSVLNFGATCTEVKSDLAP